MTSDPRGFELAGRRIGVDQAPFVVAEIGVNHDGSVERAIELVHAAAEAGADGVKFQWFEARTLVGDASATAEYQRRAGVVDQRTLLESLELQPDELGRIVEVATGIGVAPLVTVFSESLVAAARELPWAAWKTASPDIVHRPLLEALAEDGRPIVVSTGAATLDEIVRAAGWLERAEIAFLHCVSAYPTPLADAALAAMASIAEATGRPCGYSDHTASIATGGLAVAAGARILEKHLTWSTTASGPDHAASLDPDGLQDYVRFVHEAWSMLGPPMKSVGAIELDVQRAARQSIRAGSLLEAGHVISPTDLVVKRPGDGLEPWRVAEVVGRRLSRRVDADAPIRLEDLEGVGP